MRKGWGTFRARRRTNGLLLDGNSSCANGVLIERARHCFCAGPIAICCSKGDRELLALVHRIRTRLVNSWVRIDVSGTSIDENLETLGRANAEIGKPEGLFLKISKYNSHSLQQRPKRQ